MGKFVISKRPDGDLQFNLKASNGQIILTSPGYYSKDACKNSIESVKKNAKNDKRYERKTSSSDKLYFNLTSTSGLIIGTSEMYESTAARDNGIAAIKSTAPNALVEDES